MSGLSGHLSAKRREAVEALRTIEKNGTLGDSDYALAGI